MRRVAIALGVAALVLPVGADARKPVIAYVDDTTNKLKLYDAEAGAEVTAPDLTIPKVNNVSHRFALSHDGRYVAWVDNGTPKRIRLYDRAVAAELDLPGIDVYAAPNSLTVSTTGRIGFDDNTNGPARVYDSQAKSFVATGFPPADGHRQTRLSGDGTLLATTCQTGADKCVVDDATKSDVDGFVQRLAPPAADTGFPDDISGADDRGEEHPCIDADGSLVGMDVTEGGDINVYLFDRGANQVVNLPALKNAMVKEVNCVLDADGSYVGLDDFNGNFKVYERSSSSFLILPAPVATGAGFGLRWFTAPYSPPQAGGDPPPGDEQPPPPDVTAPLFEGPVRLTNRRFRIGQPAVLGAAAAPRGTHFLYTLSEAAGVRIAIDRRTTGRRVRGRCRKATRRLRKRPRCTRWVARGALEAPAAAGPNSTVFSGRVARRALRRGRYRARLTAADAAGNRSAERRVRFRIVKR